MIYLLLLLSFDPRYHTHTAVFSALDSLVDRYPGCVRLDTIGYSTRDSLPIPAIMISDHADLDEDEPAVLFIGGHHAEEVLGVELCLYMARDLLNRYRIDPVVTDWVDNREIWIVPDLNAEGHEVVLSGMDTIWRKDKRDNNDNGVFDLDYDGVDLNRNYDFHFAEGGTSDPASENYRGPGPFSENESRAIRDLALDRPFVAAISYHSARTGQGQVVYYPWHHPGGYAPDIPFIRLVADSVAKSILRDDGSGHYFALIGEGLDGQARNWLYGVCGTFAFEIEVSTACIQPGWMVDSICIRNLGGMYYLLSRVGSCVITGHITDARTRQPIVAEVILQGYGDPALPPRRSEARYGRYTRIVNPGSYTVTVQRSGYVTRTVTGIFADHGSETVVDIALEPMEYATSIAPDEPIQSIPNPAGSYPVIRLARPDEIQTLEIYDHAGRLLYTIDRPDRDTAWLLKDQNQRDVTNGVYFIVARSGDSLITKKIVLLR